VKILQIKCWYDGELWSSEFYTLNCYENPATMAQSSNLSHKCFIWHKFWFYFWRM